MSNDYNISGLDYAASAATVSSMGSFLAVIASLGVVFYIGALAISILTIIAMWKIFEKMGIEGWKSIIPIYNGWVYFSALELPGWLILLPVANGIALIVSYFRLAKKFGKGAGFGIGLWLLNPIFICILAFSKAEAIGASSTPETTTPNLMASDPVENGNVNLMTPDPIATMPSSEPVPPVQPMIEEAPSLENQITSEPNVNNTPIITETLNTPVINPEENNSASQVQADTPSTINAFAGTMPEGSANINGLETPNIADNSLSNLSVPETNTPVADNSLSNLSVPETNATIPADNNIFNNSIPNGEPLKIDQISTPSIPDTTMEMPKPLNEQTTELQKKVCPKCGYENAATVKACLRCGEFLE
jgi:ribosomal protein L40E